MTNILFHRPTNREEAVVEGSDENVDRSEAVTETMDGLEARAALLSVIRTNCFACAVSDDDDEKEENEVEEEEEVQQRRNSGNSSSGVSGVRRGEKAKKKEEVLDLGGISTKPNWWLNILGASLSGGVSDIPPKNIYGWTPGQLKTFSFEELKAATSNFRHDNFLGENGSECSTYKGWIDEILFTATKPETGIPIAVKILQELTFLGHKEWLVALGVAKGLAFLHSAETQILCGKFQICDILLDSNYNAKLLNFGLMEDDDMRPVSPRCIFIQPVVAPEYCLAGVFTAKSDVYGFGVVFLQMLSGQQGIDPNRPSGLKNLVGRAMYFLNNKQIFRVIDTRLEGQYKPRAAQKAAMLTLQCLSLYPKDRPSMDEVVVALEQLQDSN